MAISQKTTVAEFEAFLNQQEASNGTFELFSGEIVEKMPTQLHAAIISLVNFFIMLYLRDNPIGYALIEARYRIPSNSENDLIPDLSFVAKGRGPLVRSGPALYMPDLVVEAQSEGQSDKFMLDKAQLYLNNGVRMVWIIYSTRQIVEVLTPTDRQLLTANDVLSGGEVLPGFSVVVKDLFPVE